VNAYYIYMCPLLSSFIYSVPLEFSIELPLIYLVYSRAKVYGNLLILHAQYLTSM